MAGWVAQTGVRVTKASVTNNNTLRVSQETLSGPTLFSHIIGVLAALGSMSQFNLNQKYTGMALLMITDGR
jgi:hypothetical protein